MWASWLYKCVAGVPYILATRINFVRIDGTNDPLYTFALHVVRSALDTMLTAFLAS